MPEGVSLEFRSDDIERMEIAERNKKAALSVLEQAGIGPDNPQYNQYYALTLANVHHAGRYGVYDGHIEKQFVETLKDPELSIEQYREATKLFEAEMAETQMHNAEGSVFNAMKESTPYSEMRNILNDTTRSGVELRNTLNTTYPKEFYNEDGSLKRRLVVDIPPEMMEDSAMGTIDLITKKYKNVTFDKEKNSFVVKGKPIGPEKFFKNKKELLDKFKIESLDMEDSELLDIVRQGSYEKFMELRKERGMNRNKTNEQLRNALNDEVVFGEVSEKLRGAEMSKEHIAQTIKGVAEDFDAKAKIIRTEADKATLDSIDRVMFSISPADVARQSTFQDWKSCMHAVGCNHQYVDDSIGVGSVIAYGYNSQNPQKMVSRLLIHPYVNDAGEVAYGVNDRIYGKENLAFRKVVNQVTKENFNAGKEGVFSFNGRLYNDNAGSDKLKLVKFNEGEFVEIDDRYVANGVLDLSGMDFSKAGGLSFSGTFREVNLSGVKFPEHMKQLDLSNCYELDLSGVDLSQFEDLRLPEKIKGLSGTKFPEYMKQLDLSKCYDLDLSGTDLSQFEDLRLPEKIKGLSGTKFPEHMKQLDLSECYGIDLSGTDLSQFEDLRLPEQIKGLSGTKFPEHMKQLDLSECYYIDLSGTDLSQFEDLKLSPFLRDITGTNFPEGTSWFDFCDLKQVKDKWCLPKGIKNLEDIKFPETLKQLDLSRCDDIDLSVAGLPRIEDLTLPGSIKSFEGIKFPETLKRLDLTSCNNIDLSGVDLSQFEDLKLPESIESLAGTKFPKKIDFGKCYNLNLSGVDLSQVEDLTLPESIKSFEGIKFPETLKRLDLTSCNNIDLSVTDLPRIEDLTLPGSIKSFEGIRFPETLKRLDLSSCNNIDLSVTDLPRIEDLTLPGSIKSFEGIRFPETLKRLDLSSCNNIDLSVTDLPRIEDLTLPGSIKSFEGIRFPETLKRLDLSSCYYIDLSGADLSKIEDLKLPESIKGLSGTRFPALKQLDLSKCYGIDLSGADLSKIEDLKLPESIKGLSGTKFPETLKQLDLSSCYEVDLSGADLSQFEDLKLPRRIKGLSGTKFSETLKQLDLSSCHDVDLSGADLSQIEDLKLPSSIKSMAGTKFPRKVDFSECYNLNLSGADLSQIEDLKLPRSIKSMAGTKFPRKVDFSECYNLNLSGADLSQVEDLKLPKGTKNIENVRYSEKLKRLDLSKCDNIDLSGADLSQIEDLKLPERIESMVGTKFPKEVDFGNCYGINLSGADLSQVEDLKLPSVVNSLEKTKLPKNVNFSNCYIDNLDFSKADFSCVEHVKLPYTIESSSEQLKYLLTCSHLKSLDISSCLGGLDVEGMDFSKIEEVMFPDKVKNLGGAKLPKRLNFSACRSCMDMSGIDFSQCDVVKLGVTSINADFSQFAGELKLPETGKLELGNVKLPSNLKSLDLSQNQTKMSHIDLNKVEELKLPEKFAKTNDFMVEFDLETSGGNYAIISPDCKLDNLKKLDVSLCKNADLRDWNLDKIEELKLPKNFDVSKLPEGIMERNPAVARAVKISQEEIAETLEQTVVKEKVLAEQEVKVGAMPPPIEKQLQQEAKTEKTSVKMENPAAEKIQQLRGVENSGAQAVAEAGEKVAEKAAVRAGAEAVKSSGGIVSAIAKADNAVNQAIDKTIDKGSELLNNNAVGRAYEKAAEKVADTKVVKAVEKTTAKVAEKAAQTAAGKAVVKAAAKTAGSAVGKSLLKKIPLVSLGAGAYFAWDRLKEGDWKGACGEMASGALGCLPGVGTAASAAIDVGLAAKDIKTAVDESKGAAAAGQPTEVEAAGTSSGSKTEEDKKKVKEIILQKRGQHLPEVQAKVQSTPQNNDYLLQQKAAQQGRG